MKSWYECSFGDGGYMNVEATTKEEAKALALTQAREQGHDVRDVTTVVRLCGAAPEFKHAIFRLTPPKQPGENKRERICQSLEEITTDKHPVAEPPITRRAR